MVLKLLILTSMLATTIGNEAHLNVSSDVLRQHEDSTVNEVPDEASKKSPNLQQQSTALPQVHNFGLDQPREPGSSDFVQPSILQQLSPKLSQRYSLYPSASLYSGQYNAQQEVLPLLQNHPYVDQQQYKHPLNQPDQPYQTNERDNQQAYLLGNQNRGYYQDQLPNKHNQEVQPGQLFETYQPGNRVQDFLSLLLKQDCVTEKQNKNGNPYQADHRYDLNQPEKQDYLRSAKDGYSGDGCPTSSQPHSTTLWPLLSILLEFLDHNAERDKAYAVTLLMKKYLEGIPASLEKNELLFKLKLVEDHFLNNNRGYSDIHDYVGYFNFHQNDKTMVVFDGDLPGFTQPGCRDAFTTLIQTALNVYQDVAKQPNCQPNSWQQHYFTNVIAQPKQPFRFDVVYKKVPYLSPSQRPDTLWPGSVNPADSKNAYDQSPLVNSDPSPNNHYNPLIDQKYPSSYNPSNPSLYKSNIPVNPFNQYPFNTKITPLNHPLNPASSYHSNIPTNPLSPTPYNPNIPNNSSSPSPYNPHIHSNPFSPSPYNDNIPIGTLNPSPLNTFLNNPQNPLYPGILNEDLPNPGILPSETPRLNLENLLKLLENYKAPSANQPNNLYILAILKKYLQDNPNLVEPNNGSFGPQNVPSTQAKSKYLGNLDRLPNGKPFDKNTFDNLINNLQRLSSVPNQQKLHSTPNNAGFIELTYVLKRPKPLIYQPVYYIKYKLPYDTFVQNFNNLIISRPELESQPAKLYQELIALSNVTQISPELDGYHNEEVLKMVSRNGALVDARLREGPDNYINEQLSVMRNLNSNLGPELLTALNYTGNGNGRVSLFSRAEPQVGELLSEVSNDGNQQTPQFGPMRVVPQQKPIILPNKASPIAQLKSDANLQDAVMSGLANPVQAGSSVVVGPVDRTNQNN